MPTAIAQFLVTTLGISTLAASVLAAAVTIGFAYGLQSIFGPSRPKPSDGQVEVRASVGSRTRHYGIVHTGGRSSFLEIAAATSSRVRDIAAGAGRGT